MEPINTYEQEIDLKDLMFTVLHRWKMIIIAGVLCGLLFLGVKGYSIYRNQSDPATMAEEEERYQNDLELYENYKELLEQEVENLSNDIEERKEYLNESVFMNISPYNVGEARADLFIRTDYEIMPGMFYQNVDYTDTILNAYQSTMTSVAFLDEIAREAEMDVLYLQELISVERGTTTNIKRKGQDNTVAVVSDAGRLTNLLTIRVIYTDQEKAEKILKLVLDKVSGLKGQITEGIGTHEVTVVNQSSGSVVDLELASKQSDITKQLTDLKNALDQKQNDQNNLKKPAPASTAGLRSIVKYGILGGGLGVFMVVFLVCVVFLMSDKLYSSKELKLRFKLKVLGELPSKDKKVSGIDAWLNRLEGRAVNKISLDTGYELITAGISNSVDSEAALLVSGTAQKELLAQAANQLRDRLPGVRIITGGNMLQDAATLRKLPDCDGVVLVEQCGISSYQDISLEVETVVDLDKKIIGCIVFE